MWESTYELLAKKGIKRPGQSIKLSDYYSILHEISGDFSGQLNNDKQLSEKKFSDLNSRNSFVWLISNQSLTQQNDVNPHTPLKKLVSMTTSSYVHFGNFHRERHYSGTNNDWNQGRDFINFLLEHKNLVKDNYLVPTFDHKEVENADDWGNSDPRSEWKIYTYSTGKEAYKVNLDLSEVKKQFFEIPSQTRLPFGSVDLFLPHLEKIDFKTIISLRKKEGNAFIRYHRYLKDFIEKMEGADDEKKILYAMEEVDDGIRQVEEKFKIIKSSNAFINSSILVGLASIGLCIFLPEEIAEYIEAVAGGTAGATALKYFSSVKESKLKTKDNDFYFPLMLHQKS